MGAVERWKASGEDSGRWEASIDSPSVLTAACGSLEPTELGGDIAGSSTVECR
jgi:hypothetical protein